MDKPATKKKSDKPIPLDKKLYDAIKKKAGEIYEKPSAYKSAYIVREYIRQGGEYKDKKTGGGLKSWRENKWVDVDKALKQGIPVKEMKNPDFDPIKEKVACGKTKNPDAYCRPVKAVGKQKRKTIADLGARKLKKLVKEKSSKK